MENVHRILCTFLHCVASFLSIDGAILRTSNREYNGITEIRYFSPLLYHLKCGKRIMKPGRNHTKRICYLEAKCGNWSLSRRLNLMAFLLDIVIEIVSSLSRADIKTRSKVK
jgi:hypothetical protein